MTNQVENLHWICHDLQMALLIRTFSANFSFWLRKFFHLGVSKILPLPYNNKNTLKICNIELKYLMCDHKIRQLFMYLFGNEVCLGGCFLDRAFKCN